MLIPKSYAQQVSDKQIAANRANAASSTGPRTPEGKVRAAQNARSHGFAGIDFAIVKIEERDAVDRLREDLLALYQPANSQELFAVERIALAQHSLLRLARLEAGMGSASLNRALFNFKDETPYIPLQQELADASEDVRIQNRQYCLAQGFRMNIENAPTWGLFLRYQAQTERQYRRAIEEFERLKQLRPNLPNEPISTPPQPEQNPGPSSPKNEPISTPPEHSEP